MKRLVIVLSIFGLLLGCEKHEELGLIDKNNNDIENSGELPATIYARVESGESRAFVGDDSVSVLWHKYDDISHFGKKINARYYYNGDDGAAEAAFDLDTHSPYINEAIQGKCLYAVYPYDPNITILYEDPYYNFYVTYPATQTYAEGSFGKGANVMFAAEPYNGQDIYNMSGYTFRHTGGYLVLKLYGKGVGIRSITLTALNSSVALAGKACLSADQYGNYNVVMTEGKTTSEVTLEFNSVVVLGATAEEATEFWFALPPVNIEGGFKIKAVTTNDEVIEKQTTKSINIERGKVQPMAAIELDSDIAPSCQLLYTTSDGKKIDFTKDFPYLDPFNVSIKSHTYQNGRGVITFNAPLTHINENAFYDQYTLTSITLPEKLVHIGEFAFIHTNITSLTLPGSLNNIDINAFFGCTNLTSITFKPSPTGETLKISRGHDEWYNDIAPFYNSPLNTINLNREIEQFDEKGVFTPESGGEGVFYTNYKQLTTVILGDQVKTLSGYMFEDAKITEITIPASVTSIETDVFHACKNLTKITFESGSTNLKIGPTTEGTLEYGPFNDSENLTTLYLDRELVPTYDIDGDEEGFFSEIPALTNVTLGNNVKTIGNRMFLETGITSIDIPESVILIDTYAFYGCKSLQGITCNHTTPPTLGTDVFNDCGNMGYIKVPAEAVNAFKSATNWKDYSGKIIAK